MSLLFKRAVTIGLAMALFTAACTPKATPTPVDVIGTTAAELAIVMLTQTAGAQSPTPLLPTITLTPAVTETPPPEPTSNVPPKRPVVTEFTGCWTGPGDAYTLISNIDPKKYVEIIGFGNVDGWYVIRNPYFRNPCWIQMAHVRVDPNMDLTVFPVMTPGP
jgi:hypothetical protein